MAESKRSKVANVEYDATDEPSKVESTEGADRKAALEVLAKAGDVHAQQELGWHRAKEVEGFTIGQAAPKSVYFNDETQQLQDTPVGVGHVVVNKGESVRQAHIDELHVAKK